MTQDPFAPRPGSTPGGYGPPPGPADGSPYGGGIYGPPGPPGPTSVEPKAWIALLCAVLAWTPTVPFLGAIAALILSRSARRDIRASQGRLTGLSFCRWAEVLSWVHLAFVALLALAFLLFAFGLLVLPFGLTID